MIYLAALMIALQLADVYTTRRFLVAGTGYEKFWFLAWAIDTFGFWKAAAIKMAIGFASVAALVWLAPYAPTAVNAVLALLNCVYAYLVWNNWRLV